MAQRNLLLNNRAGWRTAQATNTVVDPRTGDLTLAPVSSGAVLPERVVVDRFGRTYVLDQATLEIKRDSHPLPCIGGQGSEPRRFYDPRAIAISCRDDLYVADFGNQRVQVFALKGLVLRDIWNVERIAASGFSSWRPIDIVLSPDLRAYVADYQNDAIHVFDTGGCWQTAWTGLTKPIQLAIDCEDRIYVVEEANPVVTVLDRDGSKIGQVTTPYEITGRFPLIPAADPPAPPVFETKGTVWSDALDSGVYECVWHRVAIRASIPFGCQLTVDTLTSESDKTITEILTLPEDRWATGQIDSQTGDGEWDCLIQSAPGRYLWLRIGLLGESADTPAIHRLRVYFPRQTSLRYLPAVFSQDKSGRQFLDQFLSIFDHFWEGFDHKLTNIAAWFDPAATPADAKAGLGDVDFLTWLASWLDLALDRHWPVPKRRRLLENAHRLYALRGTREGLKLHLRLYTGVEPQILEHFRLRRWLFQGAGRLGSQTALWGSDIVNHLQLDQHMIVGESQVMDTTDPLRDPFWTTAHRFSVFIPLPGEAGATEQQTIQRIVDMGKPAHTQAEIFVVRPRFRIGIQSFIGFDTVVGQYPAGIVEGKGKLGYDTVLNAGVEAGPPTMRIGATSRIGSSTRTN
ncbi:MAG TPA: phage tail protein [Bryobacteraceae bacterium]|nr:phage tail protein [Bryobacteraceae bacterium]